LYDESIFSVIHVKIAYLNNKTLTNTAGILDKFQLAEHIIAKYPGDITPMKLQKLLYYCYAWQLVADQKLFNASFEAWTHGPVEPQIYQEYKKFGREPIPPKNMSFSEVDSFFDFVLDSYSVYSAIELSKTTHLEKPWKKYKDTGDVIPDQDLIEFYRGQPFAWNFPIGQKNKFFPPKTASHFAFTFDMEKDYVPVFDSIDDYLAGFKSERLRFDGLMKEYGIQN